MEDVIIVGAGVAGLTAAIELKKAGRTYRVLEACDAPGGRARSRPLPSGRVADLGAHWLHGGDANALKPQLDRYGLDYRTDAAENTSIFGDGQVRTQPTADWLDSVIDADKAARIKNGEAADCALPDLSVDDHGRNILCDFSLMWDGLEAWAAPSAREFLTDENTPGGLQIDGGMGALIARMAEEAGADRIHTRTSVSRISQGHDSVRVQAMDGSEWLARRVIFTGSLGVLKSGMIGFTPPLSRDFHEHMAGLVMGRVNKILIELDHAFVAERGIPADTGLELLDARPPHFCHVHSAGQPIIQLYICGDQAEVIEGLTPDQGLAYAVDILAPVEALHGFEAHVVSAPIITRWVANPYTRGSYSSCLPGATRSGPRSEGLVTFCGDSFDDRYPSSLAGAYRSAVAAAQTVIDALAQVPAEVEPA